MFIAISKKKGLKQTLKVYKYSCCKLKYYGTSVTKYGNYRLWAFKWYTFCQFSKTLSF